MFQVGDLKVGFVQRPIENGMLYDRSGVTPYKGFTGCRIFGVDNKMVAEAFAYCSIRDNFSRKIGRKIALAKTMKYLPKTLRSEIWKKYFEEFPNAH